MSIVLFGISLGFLGLLLVGSVLGAYYFLMGITGYMPEMRPFTVAMVALIAVVGAVGFVWGRVAYPAFKRLSLRARRKLLVYATGLALAYVDYEVPRHVGRHASHAAVASGSSGLTWVLEWVEWLGLGLFWWFLHWAALLIVATVAATAADSFLGRERKDDDVFVDSDGMVYVSMTLIVAAAVVWFVVVVVR